MKTTMKAWLWVISVLASIPAIAQQAGPHSLTLKQCVETAINNNLQVKQTEFQNEVAAVNAKQAKNNLLPDLFGNLGHGINQGRSIDPFTNAYLNQQVKFANAGINSTVVVFNGGQLINNVKQTNLVNEANKMEVQQTRESIMLSVILAYLQILNNQDLVEQARNQAAVTRNQVERLDVLNKAGAVIPALYYDLRGQLANDELAIVNNQNQLNSARLTLAQLMNIPFDPQLTVEPLNAGDLAPRYEADPKSIYDNATQQLAIIKGVEYRRLASQQSVRVARGNKYPTVSFSTGINTNYSNAARTESVVGMVDQPSGDFVNINGSKVPVFTQSRITTQQSIGYFNQFTNNYSTSFFLNLSIPLLNGFRARNRVSLANIDVKNAAFVEQTTKTQLSQAIDQAYFNMNAAVERYNTLTRQVADFAESFRIAEVRFNAGAINQVEYLVAKNNVDRSRINLIIARYDYAFRAKILDYYKGQLVL